MRLPTELLVVILQHVWDMATLATICRANKTLLSIARRRLYHHISVPYAGHRTLTEETGIHLFRTLRHTRLSELVTNLTIEMNPEKSCTPTSRNKCRQCSKRDARLGKTLVALTSLKAFELICDLCSPAEGTHEYLFRLNQQLSSFKFQCNCRLHTCTDIVKLVSTRLVSSVSALTLELLQDETTDSLDPLSDALNQPSFLSNLKIMGQDGSASSLLIMAHRPLERVGIAWYNDHPPHRFHGSLSAHPGAIQSLFSDLIMDWSQCIREFPGIYANITELGSFSFTRQPLEDPSVLAQLSFLATLPRLQMIYINRKRSSPDESGYVTVLVDESFVHFLGKMCHSLLRVRAGDRPWEENDGPPLLWERLSPLSEWICCPLVSIIHTHWETIKGRANC